ncbi:hypothetical protein [Kribbella monticola]|uniref:hypothetical protein n=1 Tax=Kribbella monticola TaxID=2185285 RepID=UPI0018E5A14A|nr:hypothetical protein [Kribbella monticola]
MKLAAIAIEAKIGPRQLDREILPTLEQLGWVEGRRDADGTLVSIEALIPPPAELIDAASRMLDIVMATPLQRAALLLLRATTVQPLEYSTALQAVSVEFGEEAAREAVRHLVSVQLLRQVNGDDGRTVLFNPNIWVGDGDVARAALKAEDARANVEVGALIEEVAEAPGLPEAHVKSTEPRWVDFAVSQGLVQRSVVQTSSGDEQRFLFTPHLGRDAFGVASGDPSGHVRQLVGSMIYAATFASWKLHSPGGFLYTLIRDGEAGNVPQIATDYPMLETAGTIEVVPHGTWGGYRMRLLQSDVAEAALEILDSRGASRTTNPGSLASIGDQRSYSHIERERARMASEATTDDVTAQRLIDALRDVTAKRSF